MDRKSVFINMGFDPTASLDIVSTLSLSTGDRLVAVYPRSRDDPSRLRSEQTRSQVRNYINMLKTLGREIGYEELELDTSSLESALEILLEAVKSAKSEGYKVYFELTGGTRALTILMTLVATWFAEHVDEITFIGEVSRQRYSLPIVSPLQVSKRHVRRVLAVIASHTSVRRREICNILGVSESSVSRAVSELEKVGIIKGELRLLSLSQRFNVLRPLFKNLATF